MRSVCEDVVSLTPELKHIDMRRVAVAFCQARKNVQHGLFASLTPLRFENGAATGVRKGRKYRVQEVLDRHGRSMLYVLSFYLPRFMNMPFDEKLVTVFHELWHVSPRFDGDLRRHEGRCYIHTGSQKNYDAHMLSLAKKWLARRPDDGLLRFLQLSFAELQERFGAVYGDKFRRPRLLPIE